MLPPKRLIIGQVVGAFGVRGELKIKIESDFPERFAQLKTVFIADATYTVERGRLHKGMALLKLKGLETPEQATPLTNHHVEVALDDAVQLPAGKYFLYQIMGLSVETVQGEALGRVTEILHTGANDVYVVTDANGREILLPVIASVVKQVDLGNHKIIVELLAGLR